MNNEYWTYEAVLKRMVDRVKAQYPTLDYREGSLIFNALAAASLEISIAFYMLDNVRSESFVPTASREYALLGCYQMGMDTTMFDATAGTHKAEFNVEVSIDSRWNCGSYNYRVTEYIDKEGDYYTYKVLCETIGAEPNTNVGDLTAITEIPVGLNYAKLTECLIEGKDESSDNDIFNAYIEFVNRSIADGNIDQYEQWCEEHDGIGHYKIFPLWNGSNTVKVSVLSETNRRASDELVAEVQEYFDPGITGMGDGVAPIGAFVTVSTATEKEINVEATVTMQNGYSDTKEIDDAITNYFEQIAYEKTQVAYMNIGATILGVDGVESVTDVKINGGTSDIMLGQEEIPILGTTNWTVNNNVS